MIPRDLPDVLEIERLSHQFPWSEKGFCDHCRMHNCIGMVAEHGERLVGFMIYELYAKQIDVTNFAVHPEYRLRGVGRQMASVLIGKLSTHRRPLIELVCRDDLLGAHLFFRRLGFRAQNFVLGEFFEADKADGYVFRYDLRAIERETEALLSPPIVPFVRGRHTP